MIGRILGSRYELIEKIGEGGMAEVYKAKCHLLNRYVAVKILKKELSSDENVVHKFKGEAISVAKINSLNIVNIYDVGSENEINYIVMELVEGKTLKNIIKEKGKLSNDEALSIAIQIAKALECAHTRNIIHRDIKPHNILVTDEGVVKVADFGIAKVANEATITNTAKVLGSAHYFSPEQARGSIVDYRTDIYSLGIVMYEMITGKVPYDAENVVSVALKHLQEPVVPPININKNIPESLNRLILKSLEKEPIKRYQNVKEMLQDMQRIRENRGVVIESKEEKDEYTRVMTPLNVPIKNTKSRDEDYDDDDDDYGEEDRKFLKHKIMIGVVIAILTLGVVGFAGVAYNMFLAGDRGEKDMVEIPVIIGMSKEDAATTLEDLGFENVTLTPEKSELPEGEVTRVEPSEKTKVELTATIEVYFSEGVETRAVDNYIGSYIDQVKAMISNTPFELEIEEVYHENIPKGQVIDQEPKSGTELEYGGKIHVKVSKGVKEEKVKVPNLIGEELDTAQAVLSALGFEIGELEEVLTDDKTLDGQIFKQSEEKDSMIVKGSKINISYYKYDESLAKIEVPSFLNKTVLEAKMMAEEAGVKIKFIGEYQDDDIIIRQDKGAGTLINVDEEVILEVEKSTEDTVGDGGTDEGGTEGSDGDKDSTDGGENTDSGTNANKDTDDKGNQ